MPSSPHASDELGPLPLGVCTVSYGGDEPHTPAPAVSRGVEGGPLLPCSCGPLASSWEVEMGFLRSSDLGSLEVKGFSC